MKRLVVSLSVLAVLFSVVYAADIKPVYINVNSVDSLSSCNSEESHDRYYYIPSGKNVTIYPDDTYWNSNDAFIRKDSSVEIYSHGIISKCATWERTSNIVRGGGLSAPKKYPALIFRNSDGCVLSKPTYTKINNPTAIDAQIHYTVNFNLIGGGAGEGKGKNSGIFFYKDGDGKYACYPNWNTVSSASSCTSSSAYYRTDPNKHVGECLNYRVFRCGDGLINRADGDTHYANGTYTEECDPENSSWKNRTDGKICNASCKIVEPKVDPVCNSTYHNQTKYTSTSAAWLSSSDDLCSKGKVKNFKDSGKPRVFTWDCENDGTTKTCTAKQQWCGDGEVNGNEKCDPENSSWKNRTDGKTCNASCEIVEPKVDPVCNSTYHNQTKYTSTSAAWLSSSDDLCSKGKVKNFKDSGEPRVFTRDCENDGTTKTCTANQQWCGDGVRNGGEQCDYKDSTEENWGNDGCDTSCKQKIVSSSECNDTFYYTLRYGWKYTFYDKFVPTATRYLYDFDVDFKEKTPYDYNQGKNPSFKWMDDLGNGIYKEVSTTRRVIQSDPSYPIKTHPDARSKDDLYIEYNIKYADKAYSSKPDDSKLKTHKECAYYAISWCGDGVIDTDWEGKRPEDKAEECDPGSAGTSVLSDGRICNSECKIESPKGTVVIEKTLKDKIEVTYTGQELIWEVKVTASGGNVTNFEIWDKMPVELEPNGTSWWNLDKTKSQNGIDVKYSNRKPNPKSSGNVNIHYWDVTGTLNQGKSITMLVKTKVKKMPGSGKNIVNIACVIKDNKEIDCDDDQPPKTEGYLVPVKTLIGTKEVKKTGDIIKWSLKVTAKGGDVENPIIIDKLPPVLTYRIFEVKHSEGFIIPQTPELSTFQSGGETWTKIVWNTIGTLKENDNIEFEVITYANKMPEKDYNNVLCARPKDKPSDEKCDEKEIPAPKLWIKKYIMDGTNKIKEKTVKIGDEIVYRIEFGNKGTASATITSIKDFLPKNVGYRSSEVYVGGIKVNTEVVENTQKGELSLITNKYKVVDGVHIDIFGGLTLAPNTEGYIIIKGEILSGNQDNRTNFACIYLNDKKPDDDIVDGPRCDDAVHNFDMCEKLDILPAGNLNGGGSKTVTCTTMSGNADINIDCGLGATPRYITGSNINKLQGVCTYPAGVKTYNLECTVKKDGKTYKSNPSCKGNVTVQEGSTPGGFKCQSDIKDTTGTVCNGESWTVPVNCKTDGGRANKIEIFCDNSVQSSGTNVASLTGSCTFSSNGAHKIRCEVDGSTAAVNGSSCEGVYTLSHKDCGGGQTVNCGTLDVSGTDRVKNFECKATGLTNSMKLECGYNKQSYTKTGSVSSLTGTCDFTNAPYGKYTIKCYVNDDENKSCIKEVTYSSSGCFPAGTKVTMVDGTKKNIEEVKEGDIVLSYNTETNNNEGNVVKKLLVHEDNIHEMYELTINGKVLKVTDVHRFYVRESANSENYSWIEAKDLKVGNALLMADGRLVEIEKINHYPNKETVYNLTVENNHDYFVAEGYLVHNSKGPTPPGGPIGGPTPDPIIAPMAECFDINANQISYEQGEILPFYWNLDNLSKEDIWYLSGSFSKKVKAGDRCEKDAEGLVALNSMECSYDIVDSDGIVKKTGSFPCLTEENFTVNHLYQSRLDIGKNKMCGTSNNKCYFDFTTKATKTRLWSKLNAIENFGAGWTRFGEYKIRMKKISYLRCNDGEWDSKEKSEESLCESTFMLTNPYTVQKTPSGNFRASTEALSNYRYCEKYEEVRDTNVKPRCLIWNNADKLLNAIAVSEYQPNKSVDDAMQKFINKYSKLAVNAGNGLKKVPGKNIYFTDKNICLGSECNAIKLDKPTTIVQMGGDAEIKGDVNTDNLMLLTRGTIKFTDSYSCRHRQVVKGIFYAEKGIIRTPVQKNKYINSSERCTEGGLTIKGVLIGDGLQKVMENSRSNLNNWHHSKTAQTVMNGASVLIEYSPSVFTKSTMPPGAEDFTTALSIYKD